MQMRTGHPPGGAYRCDAVTCFYHITYLDMDCAKVARYGQQAATVVHDYGVAGEEAVANVDDLPRQGRRYRGT